VVIKLKKLNRLFITIIILAITLGIALVIMQLSLEKKNTIPEFSDRYLDTSLSIEERIDDLLSQMTLKEKIGQMTLVEKNSILELNDVSSYGIGGILSGAGAKPDSNTPKGWQIMVESFIDESRNSRLGIPALYGVDAIHGHSNMPEATVFPHFIGLGASGDEDLVERVARATAEELQATGILWSYSPTLDIVEDIRWGRTYETFSSDPVLVSKLGGAYVRGLQDGKSEKAEKIAVLATAKHFVGAGGMGWNSSSNENFLIDQGTTPADEAKLQEIYLPAFQSAIGEGALSVMAGLNSWGGTKLAAEKYLLTDVLKEDLGFKGFVVSDWYGVYEMPGPDFYNAVTAINAGVDMVMLPFDYKTFVQNVSRAVALRLIPETRIDDAVTRILYAKFKLGLFDNKETEISLDSIGSQGHRALAREAVAKSTVLLKNKEGILPISSNIKRIHVAGSAADNIGRQAGAWTVEWQGVDGNWLPGATSIFAGIQEVKGVDTNVEFSVDGIYAGREEMADIGIAVIGETPYAEGWGDTDQLTLSEADLTVIDNLKQNSKKVVVVLVTGRPLIIVEELPKWDALVVAWLPGSEGSGVADVLFGQKPFTGTLPLSWPRSIDQLPITADQQTQDGTPLLFERYFGLK
jgi:beta-glucosidase